MIGLSLARTIGTFVVMTAVIAGCSLPPKGLVPDNTYVTRFENVNTPTDVWVRLFEIQAESEKANIKDLPIAYRQCVGEQIVRVSPPDVTRVVEKFAKSHLYDDFYDMVGQIKNFSGRFENERGVKLYPYAFAVCEGKGMAYPAGTTYREMLETGIAAKWEADGQPRSKQPRYFDCIVEQTIATFTAAELSELNSFAKDQTRSNGDRVQAIFAARDKRFGGSSDNQVLSQCALVKGT